MTTSMIDALMLLFNMMTWVFVILRSCVDLVLLRSTRPHNGGLVVLKSGRNRWRGRFRQRIVAAVVRCRVRGRGSGERRILGRRHWWIRHRMCGHKRVVPVVLCGHVMLGYPVAVRGRTRSTQLRRITNTHVIILNSNINAIDHTGRHHRPNDYAFAIVSSPRCLNQLSNRMIYQQFVNQRSYILSLMFSSSVRSV